MRRRHRIILTINDLKIRRSDTFQLSVPFLSLTPGNVVCIVGSNGSGKTTLVEAIVGLVPPKTGQVNVSGFKAHLDIAEVKRAIGYIPDDDSWMIEELTAREYFELLASVQTQAGSHKHMVMRAKELADELLFDSFDQQLRDLSHGNKKKAQIIAGLLHDPHFIVVDELRNGLDPIAILRAEKLLKRKQMGGAAIIAATHDLWWAERFADEIIMIRRGQVVLNDFTKNIIQKSGSLESSFMEHYSNAV
ncbi:ABC transporter ATP-binding protein [Candidatus Saccharibacteria bacterium]|nr:ABC transporter ATP-binding protein [Candidatus Saccharibacteria bacterium]